MKWYQQPSTQLYELLQASDQGLPAREAKRRLKRYGPNQLAGRKEPLWRVIVEPFRSVFVAVLVVAAVVSLISHEPIEAVIIAAIILIGAVIFYSQQYTTMRVLRSLKKQSLGQVRVIRAGQEVQVAVVQLVPGDIVLLAEGERVPADGRVITEDNLLVDESSLTGESVPVHKRDAVYETTKELYEQDNMLFQGSYVVTGTGHMLVVATGENTQFGKIADLVPTEQTKSPVQQKIDGLIALMIKVIGATSVLVFALSLIRGVSTADSLRFVLSLCVSAVPEGLPVALTVIIVLGMRRMAKYKALVRSFKAIEDVGLITVIATDKTGTLTKNKLSVVETWPANQPEVLEAAGLSLDHTSLTDPLDKAIAAQSKKHHRLDEIYPFDLQARMSGGYVAKEKTIYLKGAPEHVLAQAHLSKADHTAAESAMHSLAAKGYRVIAIGKVSGVSVPPKELGDVRGVSFVGFIALADELRPEAKGAIAAAQAAGISVKLITGDHFETAFTIAQQIGIASHPTDVIEGKNLPKEKAALAAAVHSKSVFARILPADKFRILDALKKKEIVAMTGDGVNDVPALANAHVGFAMGSGSDIAKDAGGIILLDDNFATIVRAISVGRTIYANIRRMLFYLLSTSIGEVFSMIGALLFGLPLPVTAIQILWINIVTDTAMVLPLGLEPEEEHIMTQPPRRPTTPLLDRIMLQRMVLVAFTMATVTLATVLILKNRGQSTAYIQTVAFMSLVAAQWVNAFNARSERRSSFTRVGTLNHGLNVGFAIGVILQGLVMFGPLKSVFSIANVPIVTLLASSGVAVIAVLFVSELHKLATRRMKIQQAEPS